MVAIFVKVKPGHLFIVFTLALSAFSVLFWPTGNSRIQYWQDKLFSPGATSIAHQKDEDGKKILCQVCHQPGKAITNSVCRECHDGEYFKQNAPLLADAHKLFDKHDYCLRCHGEHDGYYTALKISFTEQTHKSGLRVKTDKCSDCHRLKGKQVHPSSINEDCAVCHKNYEWSSDFTHKQFLAKATSKEQLLKLCEDCHNKGHHYTLEPRAQADCILCHEFWSRRKKNRPIPFPEKLFSDISLSSDNFQL